MTHPSAVPGSSPGDSPSGYVAVVGENVADAVVDDAADGRDPNGGPLRMRVFAGGGPANTAVALGRLGTSTRLLCRMPRGVLGDLFSRRLASASVDLSLTVPADEPATLAITSVADGGAARYEFHATATADWQWRPDELDPRRLREAACVHAGSLGLVMEPGGPLVEELLERVREHALVSIDPNVRAELVSPARYRARMDRWCRLADIIRLSEDDLAHLAPGSSPRSACDRWHEAGAPLVVITRGGDGVFASLRGVTIEVPSLPVTLVDTIGAGDAFSAGLLHWLDRTGRLGGRLAGLDVDGARRMLAFASQVATLTCAVPGADPPHHADLTSAALDLLH
ncbi:MAG: carbohydrate kinase family protein [Frankia sp.]